MRVVIKVRAVGWRKLRVLQLGDKFAILPKGIRVNLRIKTLRAVVGQEVIETCSLHSMGGYPTVLKRLARH